MEGIAGYTAFLVFGAARLLPLFAPKQLFALFWILPSLIGVPAVFMTVAYYQRKFSRARALIPKDASRWALNQGEGHLGSSHNAECAPRANRFHSSLVTKRFTSGIKWVHGSTIRRGSS